VALFLDVPNLWAASRDALFPLDAEAARQIASEYGRVTIARAYFSIQAGKGLHSGAREWAAAGFEPRPRIVEPREDGVKDIDSLLCADALCAAYEGRFDVMVLASADSDFLPILQAVRRLGKIAVLILGPGQRSRQLEAGSDATRFLLEPQRHQASRSPDLVSETRG
jgi:uncharacterized protein (TIGR00288 family)